MTNEERRAALEAIIYAADEPATIEQLAAALGEEKLVVQAALDELVAAHAAPDRGIEIRAVAGGYKTYTKPEHHEVVRRFIKSLRPALRLTMPALETLAVISYKQPVTVPEISEIRGVNTSGVIKTLLDKRLITTAGRKEVMGRPILYKTSKEFLMRFGLSDLSELPSLKEFEALAREALGSDEGVAVGYEGGDAENSKGTRIASVAGESVMGMENSLKKKEEEVAAEALATGEGMPAGVSDELPKPPTGAEDSKIAKKEEIAAEVVATGEGMPAGESDELPKAATAGE
ncbi:MAG TPA: SMC-Scp complex subunit ScpB [Candidatus Dormibacteraeota bacterium]|nr:SMC-Scp complex subunit ScpB [Candidatus Dormibacteraeota bacterium]